MTEIQKRAMICTYETKETLDEIMKKGVLETENFGVGEDDEYYYICTKPENKSEHCYWMVNKKTGKSRRGVITSWIMISDDIKRIPPPYNLKIG